MLAIFMFGLVFIFFIVSLIFLILGIKQIKKKKDSKICDECGKEFKGKKICEKCGNPNPYNKLKMIIYFIVAGISLIIFLTSSLYVVSRLLNINIFGIYTSSDISSNERNDSIPQLEVIVDSINIRKEKSINSTKLGEVYNGEIYTIIEEDENSIYHWYKIETSTGIRGYIAGKGPGGIYVKELEIAGIENTEEPEAVPETNTNNQNNNTNNSNSSNNHNNNSNNYTPPTPQEPVKKCNEVEKQRITNEYNTTLQQREAQYQTDMAAAKQKLDLAKDALDSTGGYLSATDYNTQYAAATSKVQKDLLTARYNMSVNYDKMVNTYNALEPTFNEWKNTYYAWYQEALKNAGC